MIEAAVRIIYTYVRTNACRCKVPCIQAACAVQYSCVLVIFSGTVLIADKLACIISTGVHVCNSVGSSKKGHCVVYVTSERTDLSEQAERNGNGYSWFTNVVRPPARFFFCFLPSPAFNVLRTLHRPRMKVRMYSRQVYICIIYTRPVIQPKCTTYTFSHTLINSFIAMCSREMFCFSILWHEKKNKAYCTENNQGTLWQGSTNSSISGSVELYRTECMQTGFTAIAP